MYSHERQFIARGLFNPHSAIRVRLYRWRTRAIDEAYWRGAGCPPRSASGAKCSGLEGPGADLPLAWSP